MMGGAGLTQATKIAILSANYIAKRLEGAYPALYRAKNGRVAHECIIDTRPLATSAGVTTSFCFAQRLLAHRFAYQRAMAMHADTAAVTAGSAH